MATLDPVSANSSPRSDVAVEFRGVSKTFGSLRANNNVCLKIARGEIHGIIGENGAGKSTLMSMLYGLYRADVGEIWVTGAARDIARPTDAMALGIGMVHQHFMLVDSLSTIDNVILGAEGGFRLAACQRKAIDTLRELERTHHFQVPLDVPVRHLPVGLQQRVEILKALYRKARILILDEPTAVLTPTESTQLFEILKGLRKQGTTIIFISHKLGEITALTDTVTVMRQGCVVKTMPTAEATEGELAQLMIGRALSGARPRRSQGSTDIAIEARNLTYVDDRKVPRLKDVSLRLYRGEILGVAAVSGNGQSELLEILSGLLRPTQGDFTVNGHTFSRLAPARSQSVRDLDVAHVPEDRLRDGVVREFDAAECVLLGRHNDRRFNGRVFSRTDFVRLHTAALMSEHDVRPQNPGLKISAFSGGNQQKLVIGRELDNHPKILLIGQPTRGVDVGAIEAIHDRLISLRNGGAAILLVSSELEEIRALSDRIIVMCAGKLVGELAPHEYSDERLGLLMAGVAAQ
jgi:ABC-type uncharacterized transport system ATPase subunit